MTALESLNAIVLRAMAFVRFYPAFACKVVAQNDDLSLELQPDSAFLPGLSKVPMRTFAPGVAMKVSPGARCAVQFEDGNPGKPVATLFELGSLLELSISAGARVTINAPVVNIGGTSPADAAALASKVIVALADIKTMFNGHIHPAPGGATSPTATPITASTDVSSAVLKLSS